MQLDTQANEHYDMMKERDFFAELMDLRDRQRISTAAASPLLDGDRIPWQLSPLGYVKWYMAPTMDDLPMNVYTMYLLKIPVGSRSGRLHTPGDEVAYVWHGERGYTTIGEDRHDWNRGDVLQIPSRPEGCTIQHFNVGDTDVEMMFCRVNTALSCGVDRGAGLEVLEDCPEYQSRGAE